MQLLAEKAYEPIPRKNTEATDGLTGVTVQKLRTLPVAIVGGGGGGAGKLFSNP